MLSVFTDSTPLLVLFLLIVLVALVLLFGGGASQTWTLDLDADGMYPASDCGQNYTLQLKTPHGICNVKKVDAAPVLEEAGRKMQQEHGGEQMSERQFFETLQDYLGATLERIAPAW